MSELNTFDDAMKIVDTLAEMADEDLDLVAQALSRHTIAHGKGVLFDMEAAQRWIARQVDARAFEH